MTDTSETIPDPASATPGNQLLGLVEKTLATYVQALIALLIAAPTLDFSLPTVEAAAIAAIPAGLTIIANGLPGIPVGLPFYTDLLLRAVRTFAASFLGFLIAVPVFSLDEAVLTAAAVGAIPTVLSVIKSALAKRVGADDTAALLPASSDPGVLA
jgi:hypothetical protein